MGWRGMWCVAASLPAAEVWGGSEQEDPSAHVFVCRIRSCTSVEVLISPPGRHVLSL